jgi:D-aminopeptidase
LAQLKAFGEGLLQNPLHTDLYKAEWPTLLQAPYTLNITFVNPVYADIAETMPGLTRLSGTEVQLGAMACLHELYLAFQTLYSLTAYQKTI